MGDSLLSVVFNRAQTIHRPYVNLPATRTSHPISLSAGGAADQRKLREQVTLAYHGQRPVQRATSGWFQDVLAPPTQPRSITEDNTAEMNGSDPHSPSLPDVSSLNFLRRALRSRSKIPFSALCIPYHTLKQRSQLHLLTPKEQTDIISLTGGLVLPAPREPCIYSSKYVFHTEGHVLRGDEAREGEDDGMDGREGVIEEEAGGLRNWDFVLEVAKDKEGMGRNLSDADWYWVLCAKLGKGAKSSLSSGEHRTLCLSSGALIFIPLPVGSAEDGRLQALLLGPEIYFPSLRAPFTPKSRQHVDELVNLLSTVLGLHSHSHPRLVELLWEVVLKHGNELREKTKERLIWMALKRLRNSGEGATASGVIHTTDCVGLHGDIALGTPLLGIALAAVIFPSYNFTISQPVRQWAHAQAVAAFAPEVPLQTRWGNFLLLAASNLPVVTSESQIAPLPAQVARLNAGIVDWRAIFVLTTVERVVRGFDSSSLSLKHDEMHAIVRPLWRTWKQIGESGDVRPMIISQAIVTAFFRLAQMTMDEPLREGCFRYCVAQGLWTSPNADHRAQRRELISAYLLASARCMGKRWVEIFSTLTPILPGTDWKSEALEGLILHYLAEDITTSHELYTFGQIHGIPLSIRVVRSVSVALASRSLETAIPFLRDPRFSPIDVEELLYAILRPLQEQCREYLEPHLVEALGKAVLELYTKPPVRLPSPHLKHPTRHLVTMMVTIGHSSTALHIIRAIHRHSPSFFTIPFFRRFMRALLRYRQFRNAAELLPLIKHAAPTPSVDDFRRKLTLGLARAGAHSLAEDIYRTGISQKVRRSTRESLAHSVGFRVKAPPRHLAIHVIPIVTRNPPDAPSLKFAISILIHARRYLAARKLLERTHRDLDAKTCTWLGNTILHGPLLSLAQRNGRLVRHILRTKELLMHKYGFIPDRVTINIILKSILCWRTVIDPSKIKALFDHMIRGGYPAGERWRRDGGVPFSTPASPPSNEFQLSALPPSISFERHVRPMYKMFIKALYLRGDVRAAKTIVGIFKDEEVAAMHEREKRNRARELGRIKARKKRGRR